MTEAANDDDDMVMEEGHVRRRVRTTTLWLSSTMTDLVVGEPDAGGDDGGAHGSAMRSMAEKCLSCGDLIASFFWCFGFVFSPSLLLYFFPAKSLAAAALVRVCRDFIMFLSFVVSFLLLLL